jgi:DNA-binding HxlR family transcriptional regulator
MSALKKELDELVTQDIIEKIDYPTPWLHPIVRVPKKGITDIRLCVDFTKLNNYVKPSINPRSTP